MTKMKKLLEKWLKQLEDNGEILIVKRVTGGDINEAFYVRTKENEYFVKLNRKVDRHFFDFEAKGLQSIRDTNMIHVPYVYGVFEVDNKPMIWMEWVNGRRTNDTEKWLGERLASMHLADGQDYGFEGKGYIGSLPIEGKVMKSWLEYYRDIRLMNQLNLGQKTGRIRGKREKQLYKLLERLDRWIPDQPKSSLLHGDLWGGNWITGENGNPYLIDPSVLRGDHEFELAFTQLFGGFSQRFYKAYETVFPLSDEYETRKELYQLYYLLVHLNLFGESYGNSVDCILNKYVGD